MQPETKIKKQITDYLKARGYIVNRLQAGQVRVRGGWMQLCDEGTPDCHALGIRGRHFYFETKKPGGKPSEQQLDKKAEYELRGFIVIIADSLEGMIEQMKSKGIPV